MHFKSNFAFSLDTLIEAIEKMNSENSKSNNKLYVFTAAGIYVGRCYDPENTETTAKICIEAVLAASEESLKSGELTGEIGYFFLTDVSFFASGLKAVPNKLGFVQLFSDQIIGLSIGSDSAVSPNH